MLARITIIAGLAAGVALSAAAPNTSAALFNVSWLSFAPTPFTTQPANNTSYNLPGVGLVNVSYSTDPAFVSARLDQTATIGNGSVTNGTDTYQWTNYESFARSHTAQSPLNIPWTIKYTFPSTIPAGQIVLGVSGLGRRDPRPGENAADCITTCSVAQNGTFFGDFGPAIYGPTAFVGAAGSFSMTNSLTGAGGNDPWWNTPLAITRIDDSLNSLTVSFTQTAGDGIGLNIGYLAPSPGAGALFAMSGLVALRRRR